MKSFRFPVYPLLLLLCSLACSGGRGGAGDVPGLDEITAAQRELIQTYRSTAQHRPEDLEIGQPAPDIVGTTYDGNFLRLSDFRGKVVVLDFWGGTGDRPAGPCTHTSGRLWRD